jgi:DNA-binding FrmR family transcriptional regulator
MSLMIKFMKKGCCDYPSHEAQLPRINRVIGQLEGMKKMISSRRYCPEILVQFKAIKAAIKAVEIEILNSHLGACVADSFKSGRDREKKIAEIKTLLARMG